MHQLAVVLVPFGPEHTSIRPLAARDEGTRARLDTLLFQVTQPDRAAWGVDFEQGFEMDWWSIGGRWTGWGRDVRALMRRQRVRPATRPIPRFLLANTVWTEDLARVRLSSPVFPDAMLTPHGVWNEAGVLLMGSKTARERKAKAAWLRRIREVVQMYDRHLAVAIDYHF